MSFNKVSKKASHSDYRTTLLAVHEEKMEGFRLERETLSEKKVLLNQLKKSYFSFKNRNINTNSREINEQLREKDKQITDLEEKIMRIETGLDESEYLLSSYPYITKYIDQIKKNTTTQDPKGSSTESSKGTFGYVKNKSNKGEIYREYMKKCMNTRIPGESTSTTQDELVCDLCNVMRVVNITEALAVCTECGSAVKFQDTSTNVEFSNEIQVLSPFAYKRLNHFKEHLVQLQGRESSPPTQEIIDSLLIELKKDRITDVNDVTMDRIKSYLKKLRLNKHYEHIPAIINKLCGLPPPIITRELEQKLISMFEQMQAPFDIHCPSNRKNFLSYSYTLHKMCQQLGEIHLLPCFPLLKSREKLYLQDQIYSKICEDLNWSFKPSL